jgi:anti-anti-sigma factor
MRDGIAVIYCRGRILAEETEELRTAASEAIERTGRVILELQSVEKIDSTGLGLLASLCLSARKHSGDLKLVNPSSYVSEVLEITMLGRVFTVYPSVEAALAA